MDVDARWRSVIAERAGGAVFDAPGGGYAFSNVLAEERELSKANRPGDPGSALLTLSIADPIWKMRPEAMDAARRYYDNSPDATRYTDNAGVREGAGFQDTHEAIAAYLNKRRPDSPVQLNADWVQYSPGSIKRCLAEYLPSVLFDENSTLIFPVPGYPVIKSALNKRGADAIDAPMTYEDGKWRLNTQMYLPTGRKLFMYVNIPHTPTGTGYTADDWARLLEWADENDALLIVDEAYIDIAYKPDIASVLTVPGWERRCVVLQSVSKAWNATGLRFGWIAAHPTFIKAVRKATDVKDSGMFGPSIAAGLECLSRPDWADETRGAYAELHERLYEALVGAGFKSAMPDAGLCQFTPGPTAANGRQFESAVDCVQWFRQELRISLMHYTVDERIWLRWAATIRPLPECGLPTEASVVEEAARRLRTVEFAFEA